MKKILICFFSVFFVANAALAADDLKAKECFDYFTTDNIFRVFFDNDKSNLPVIDDQDCNNMVTEELTAVLKDKTSDDLDIVIIAKTSRSASYKHNEDLSKRRADTVYALIKQINPGIKIYNQYTGESNANVFNEEINNPDDRSVLVLFLNKDKPIPKDESKSEDDRNKIKDLYAKLMGFSFISAERNVWKDAEGKFNTSRLISDSVAGVVLGTAGGLITSSVVKKNQLEDGFEDIKCTIGGQSVATWGDEFYVGKH